MAMVSELSSLAKEVPGHMVHDECLWLGQVRVEIDHIDNDLEKPLDYIKAFKQMIKLKSKES